MTKGVLINDLELGYAPMSAYHFTKLIEDSNFHNNVLDSHIYIIAQRKQVTFSNFFFYKNQDISFDINQEGNPKIIRCILPLIQNKIVTDLSKTIDLRIHNRKNKIGKKIGFPFNGTQGFSVQQSDLINNTRQIANWFSADKLFYSYWKGEIRANFTDTFYDLLDYTVHYVGKSTEQNICKRLSSHSTFQKILSTQESLSYNDIPSNEIMILLFRIKDNNTIVKWGDEATDKEMSDYLTNYFLPNDKTISLDAEKALINKLQPKYNKVLYNSFPNKKDLVNTDYHNLILYGLSDPIKLLYEKGTIKGDYDPGERDYISVERKS